MGWLAVDDYQANLANNEWLKYFAYSNVGDVQAWTVNRLTPGIDYWLIACESLNDVEPGATPRCTGWERLTLAAGTACPAAPATGQDTSGTVTGQDYDADDDGLIEIRSIDQLDAIRHDLDGDGAAADDGASAYAAAFPGAADGMGCPSGGCTGYELANDLDYATVGISANGWLPIGYYNSDANHAAFNATFDGNDRTIANLYVSRGDTNYVGLFGFTGSDSVVKRVGLTSANVVGHHTVGGLVGHNNGAISDSYVTGGVSGTNNRRGAFVGGLVGFNNGSISDSYATAGVAGSGDDVGGLAGLNWGTITASYAAGSVSGDNNAGGLVGRNSDSGAITASYATGGVSGNSQVGGLVGVNNDSGTITVSYATGSASASASRNAKVGGLVGWNERGGAIIATYANGSVSGDDNVGGLVGDNDGTITASYTTVSVSLGGSSGGGLDGTHKWGGSITASYWDNQISELISQSGGPGGLTTAELQSPTGATGIYATWNPNWWDFGTSSQYPVLEVDGLDVAAQRQ